MALVEGANFTDGALPHLTEGARTIVYHGMIDTLAALHRIDPQAAGLATFGRPGNFFERQVARWIKQYRASETDRIEVAERLIVWLPATLPPNDQSLGHLDSVGLGCRDRQNRGGRATDRLAASDLASADRRRDRARRLSDRQSHHGSIRRENTRGSRLGAFDARRSTLGLLVFPDELGHAGRWTCGAAGPRSRSARHPDARAGGCAILRENVARCDSRSRLVFCLQPVSSLGDRAGRQEAAHGRQCLECARRRVGGPLAADRGPGMALCGARRCLRLDFWHNPLFCKPAHHGGVVRRGVAAVVEVGTALF